MTKDPDWERFANEITEDWDRPSLWSVSGSIDLKDRGAEIDFAYRDPNSSEAPATPPADSLLPEEENSA